MFEDVLTSPNPALAAAPPPQNFVTYYVDEHWNVQRVQTNRKTKESLKAFVRRHKRSLQAYQKEFKPDPEKSKQFALARAKYARR